MCLPKRFTQIMTAALTLASLLVLPWLPVSSAADRPAESQVLVGPPVPEVAVSSAPERAETPAAVLTVCPGGPPTCNFSIIQDAVDAAGDGDTIKVATGVYTGTHGRPAPLGYLGPAVITQVVYISKTITVQGGYTTTNWVIPDPIANPTTLDAQGQGRVLFIGGEISPTVEGLRITGGDADSLGGGVYGNDAGGGLHIISATATIRNNQIYGNTAGGDLHSYGGGLYLYQSAATLSRNTVISNSAEWGGGLFLFGSAPTLISNTVSHNSGSGLFLFGSGATLISNTVSHNNVAGLYLQDSPATLISNTVSHNNGDGLYLYGSDATLLMSNTVSNNSGRGLYLWYSGATLIGNMVTANTGGLYLDASPATLVRNTISNNNASEGGGLYLDSSDATLIGNTIISNTVYEGLIGSSGGGLYLDSSDAILEGNTISANTAGGGYESRGGGLYVFESDPTLINNVIAENQASNLGSGLYIAASSPRLLHNTIARNRGGDGSGVYARGYMGWPSTVAMTNTILVSHTVGIYVGHDDTAILEATLWGSGAWANETDWAGNVITGTINVWGEPDFLDPHVGDYHIGLGSAAIDAGVDAGVVVDIDGEPRPAGLGYDIGADETGLLVMKRALPDPVAAGGHLTYTLYLTNSSQVSFTAIISDILPAQVTPTGVLTWAAVLTSPGGTWTEQITVTVDLGYVGLLTNVVQVSTEEGATGAYTCVATVEEPIAGLVASNDSPTALGDPTTLTATITAGSNVSFTWAFGDGTYDSGAVVTHTYFFVGVYTAVVTASNGVSLLAETTPVTVFLPCEPVTRANFTWTPLTPTAGQPVAFTGIAWAGSEGWISETVDSGEDMGAYNSLALDPDGYPHISYYGGDHLKYARYNGISWIIETVDSAGHVGLFTSLALDPAGLPHISYYHGTNWNLKYARYDGINWIIETVDSDGLFTSLALDAAGYPHISYLHQDNGDLRYAHYDGTSWQIETVDGAGWVGGYTSLALDVAGQPHISYYDWTNRDLKYAWHDGSSWQIETVDSEGSVGLWTSLALDTDDHPHIAYHYTTTGALRYAWHDGSTWITDTVDNGGYVGTHTSLALDASGLPHISYYAASPNHDLRYAHYDGSVWISETLDSAGDVGSCTSLALDARDFPRISYCSAWPDGELRYVQLGILPSPPITYIWDLGDGNFSEGEVISHNYDLPGSYTVVLTATNCATATATMAHTITVIDEPPCDPVSGADFVWTPLSPTVGQEATFIGTAWANSGWLTETVDSGEWVGVHNSLALDAFGRPHISYNDSNDDLRYVYYDGFIWISETVDNAGDVGLFNSLALDTAGYPHISYFDQTYGDMNLKYGYYDGSAWQIQTVDSFGWVGWHTSLALDAADYPHISYYGGGDLKYAHYDGSAWITETVDSAGLVGFYTSLALDTASRPHISYYDWTNSDLKYAWHDGSSWQIETVDSEEDVGQWTSLALDPDDHPHIAYAYTTTGALRYAWHDGSIWITDTVDSGGQTGEFTSLALDSAGRPHISYREGWPEGNLKYAHYDGSAWISETVDTAGNMGWCTSLALDVAGQPHISYYNNTWPDGELRYVQMGVPPSPPISYTWDLGDGTFAAGEVISHGYDLPGSYTVVLTATNCGTATATAVHTLVVICDPVETVTVEGPISLLVEETGLYTATYTPITATTPVTFTWDNGTVGPSAVYSWTMPGAYTVTVTATNACGLVRDTFIVEVCQAVEAAAVQGPATLLVGETGLYTATYIPITATTPVTFTWDNGTVGPTAVYSWTMPGSYTVAVTATNACGLVRDTFTVEVCQAVEAAAVQGPATLLVGETGLYTATYTPITATTPVIFTWDNSTVGPTAVYSWTTPGAYTVTVTATNACGLVRDTFIVEVCQAVEAAVVQGPATLLVGETGLYTATYTPITATTPVTFTWDNGAVGPTAVYSWTMPGTYTIAITATNACGWVSGGFVVEVSPILYEIYLPLVLRGW